MFDVYHCHFGVYLVPYCCVFLRDGVLRGMKHSGGGNLQDVFKLGTMSFLRNPQSRNEGSLRLYS